MHSSLYLFFLHSYPFRSLLHSPPFFPFILFCFWESELEQGVVLALVLVLVALCWAGTAWLGLGWVESIDWFASLSTLCTYSDFGLYTRLFLSLWLIQVLAASCSQFPRGPTWGFVVSPLPPRPTCTYHPYHRQYIYIIYTWISTPVSTIRRNIHTEHIVPPHLTGRPTHPSIYLPRLSEILSLAKYI